MLNGALLIEIIFSWGGLGTYAWIGIFRNDITVIMGVTLTASLTFMLVNLVIDLTYPFLDPAHPLQLSEASWTPHERRRRKLRPTGQPSICRKTSGPGSASPEQSISPLPCGTIRCRYIGLLILALLIVMVLAPELFTTQSATLLNLRNKFLVPSAEHPFGTDHMGVDIFSRVVYAARTTIWVVFVVVLSIATGLGLPVIGSTGGLHGRPRRQHTDAHD